MKKILLALITILIPFKVYATEFDSVGLSTYIAPLYYLNSSKNFGGTLGGYGYYNIEKHHLFEGNLSFNYLNTTSPLYIENLALAYSNYQLENNSFRIGGHFVNTSLQTNDQTLTGFIGNNYTFSENFSVGIDFYTSFYNYYTSLQPVFQISPSITITLGDFYDSGNYFITLKGHYIKLPEELTAGILVLKRNYYSGELSFTYNYMNMWIFNLFGWGGKQVFAVRNNGFSIYNSPEEHFAGYGLSLKHALSENTAITFGLYNEHFIENINKNNSMMFSAPIFIDYNF